MADNTKISKNPSLDLPVESVVSRIIDRKFGLPEDYIEAHIYNQNNQLLTSINNFTDFTKSADLANELSMDPISILNNNGYSTGKYKLIFNILRKKVFNTSTKTFIIKAISPSRTELRVTAKDISNNDLKQASQQFINEISNSPFLRDFVLNFGENKIVLGVNIILNEIPSTSELLIKLNEPLPSGISTLSVFSIAEEITSQIIIDQDLGSLEFTDNSIPLKGPNFKIDVRLNSSIPSEYRSYNDILKYESTSSYQNLLSKLENREVPEIQYDYVRTSIGANEGDPIVETYHFENFVHFGSALERVKNFKHKMELLEIYNSQMEKINTNLDPSYQSSFTINEYNNVNDKKTNLLKGLDGYEQFLYYETGAYAWPKESPHNLYSINSAEVKTWLGDERDTHPNYGGQLLSASKFDNQNNNSLIRLVPNHIIENSDNSFYLTFVNMMGHHYDQIWTHIKHLTEVNDSHHTRGISKDLVYHSLKSLGLETFDQFENSNLIEYILGEGSSGSAFYDVPTNHTLVTTSNAGSIPKENITKEIWKRLYHNAPYLLKTKGTERGLKALMSCYGVPATILNVKEYGGSSRDKTTYKTFSYEKSGLALKGDSGTEGYFIKTVWSSSATNALSSSAKTVEFRIKPTRSNDNYILFTLTGSQYNSRNRSLILEPYIGNDKLVSGDAEQYGKLVYKDFDNNTQSSTEDFPIYNGDFWNVFIGAKLNGDKVNTKFGVYQSNHLKSVNYYTSSDYDIPNASENVWGVQPTNSTNASLQQRMAGSPYCYIGGLPPGGANDAIDGLRYSGSLQEVRYHFGELLSHETLKQHALEPFMYSGNTPSSSYENLVLRLPLGSNDFRDFKDYHPNYNVNYLLPTIEEFFPNGSFTNLDDTVDPQIAGITSLNTNNVISSIENEQLKVTFNTSYNFVDINFPEDTPHQTYQLSFRASRPGKIRFNDNDSWTNFINHDSGLVIFTFTHATPTFHSFKLQALTEGTTYYDDFSLQEASKAYLINNMSSPTWEEVIETHHLPTPDTVGISTTSEKTRIDTGTVDDNWLSVNKKGETSTQDRQPLDYPDVGVFFSPTNEINEDILYTLGSFRLDDYIGSPLPSAQTASVYEDLADIKDIYFKKVKRRFNYWDYIKLIQQIDHTLFKIIEQWVPAKANLKTGLLIEPHYLERTKFKRNTPVIEYGQSMLPNSYNTFEFEFDPEKQFSLTNSAVITTNNFSSITGSDGQRQEQGTNGTINVNGYVLDEPQSLTQKPPRTTLREDKIRYYDDFSSYSQLVDVKDSETGWEETSISKLYPGTSTTRGTSGSFIGAGDKSSLETSSSQGGVSGSKVLRVGNLGGDDDGMWMTSKTKIPYNSDTIYQLDVRVKGASNGDCFVGFMGYNIAGSEIGPVYIAINGDTLSNGGINQPANWQLSSGFVRGRSSTTPHENSQPYPTSMPTGTVFVSPIVLFNWEDDSTPTGESFIDYIRVTEQNVNIEIENTSIEKSSVLLGNASKGRISSRYYRRLVDNQELNF